MGKNITPVPWHDVPLEYRAAWHTVFNASHEGLNLSAPCPVCGFPALHRWFQVGGAKERVVDSQHFIARGASTEWCSHCRSFEHATALVPDWWSSDLVVDLGRFTGDPEAIEAAMHAQGDQI